MAPDEPKEKMTREEIDPHTLDVMPAQQPEQGTQGPPNDQKGSGAASQDDIDAMIARQREQDQEAPGEAVLQQKLDGIFAQQQFEAPADEKKGVWDGLDQDIMSQDEIDVLLSGFNGEGSAQAHGVDTAITHQEKEHPGPVDDITVISRQNHLERQRKKEENILQEKKRAAALISELLRMEERRISCIMAAKDKMVNEDLYARYEITRSDRTKIIVSMSEKTAEEYRLVHPGCCMYRI